MKREGPSFMHTPPHKSSHGSRQSDGNGRHVVIDSSGSSNLDSPGSPIAHSTEHKGFAAVLMERLRLHRGNATKSAG